MKEAFGIVGGDLRQLHLAASIAGDGCPVYTSCLENAAGGFGLPRLGLGELAGKCETIVLPLPASRDGRYLNTPLSDQDIWLDDGFARLFAGKRVFGGMLGKLKSSSALWQQAHCQDYYDREELVVGNAYLTAEAAVGLAIQEYQGTLLGSRCLVTGFGRIGKALCAMLRGMGARVSCAARRASDLTAIRACGYAPAVYGELSGPYDLIFNTVPARVLEAEMLECQARDTLVFELASAPGGVDREAAERLGIRVIWAQSLPGRMSPRASGELIKEAIYHMIEEG